MASEAWLASRARVLTPIFPRRTRRVRSLRPGRWPLANTPRRRSVVVPDAKAASEILEQ
jgi:hypothetical protein